jgi:hypothetical protein
MVSTHLGPSWKPAWMSSWLLVQSRPSTCWLLLLPSVPPGGTATRLLVPPPVSPLLGDAGAEAELPADVPVLGVHPVWGVFDAAALGLAVVPVSFTWFSTLPPSEVARSVSVFHLCRVLLGLGQAEDCGCCDRKPNRVPALDIWVTVSSPPTTRTTALMAMTRLLRSAVGPLRCADLCMTEPFSFSLRAPGGRLEGWGAARVGLAPEVSAGRSARSSRRLRRGPTPVALARPEIPNGQLSHLLRVWHAVRHELAAMGTSTRLFAFDGSKYEPNLSNVKRATKN